MSKKEKEPEEKKEKPLERWTIKELREEALKIPNVQGIHGMNKQEIMSALREVKGISAPETKKKTDGVRAVKLQVTEMRTSRNDERSGGASRERLNILRKKISRLKKRTKQ
ncbi:MAG: transcription termination factor Rho [Desulfomonile sp.]|nr:transcription termination factor Rho [Deltaproteobacteria bacterium]